MRLTGRFNLRRTMTGKIVLQVEEEVKARWPFSRNGGLRRRWRDANVMDLAKPEMRALIDLRNKPQFMPQSYPWTPEETPASLMDEFATEKTVRPPAKPAEVGRISTH
jgi:hypothetical protein